MVMRSIPDWLQEKIYASPFMTMIQQLLIRAPIGDQFAYVFQRLAADMKDTNGKYQFEGVEDVYRQTWKSDGLLGFYRGYSVSIVGIVAYRLLYFGLYDFLHVGSLGECILIVQPLVQKEEPLLITSFLFGIAVTMGSKVLAQPFAVVQSRMAQRSTEPTKYKSWLHAMRSIAQDEGVGALFQGVGVDILKGLVNSLLLTCIDMGVKSMKG